MRNLWPKWIAAPAVALMCAGALAPLSLAQMGGGMMGGSGGGMMGGGATGYGGYMNGAMMGGNMMWSGVPAVGPDGSAYMIRRSGAGSSQFMWGVQKAELVAISPENGTARVLANLEGTMISQPVTGRDGRIFVTTSEPGMAWYGMTGAPRNYPDGTNRTPELIIVTPGGQTKTVTIDAGYVSAPRVADTPNGYVVYVVASQSGSQFMQGGGETFLCGFSEDGTQKFKVPLTRN